MPDTPKPDTPKQLAKELVDVLKRIVALIEESADPNGELRQPFLNAFHQERPLPRGVECNGVNGLTLDRLGFLLNRLLSGNNMTRR